MGSKESFMERGKYILAATLGALAVLGMLSLACKCGKSKSDEKLDEEVSKSLGEALGEAIAKEIEQGMPSTDPSEAKLAVVEESINIDRTKYSTTVYCYVKNDGKAPNGASVKATFKDSGGTIVGTANGYVSDIIPGRKKAVQLFSSDKVSGDATVKVEIDNISGYGNTGEDDLEYKNISVKKQYGYPKVMGEVTNNGSDAHSFTSNAVFYDSSGTIIGMAICGSISDLATGSTKTFDCTTSNKIKSWDKVEMEVASMLQ
jgi:hypothetical protein